jgi:SecD/SecF fusion protein
MQGKGLIKFFLVLMAIVAALQLFYFFPTNKVEKNASEYAETVASKVGVESKDVAYRSARTKFLDSMSTEKIFTIPGLASYTYNDLKSRQLNLGLDLKGGMSTLLEVDLSELLIALAGRNAKDSEFTKALANAKLAQRNEQTNFIALFVREYTRLAPNKKLANIFAQSASLGGNINAETSNQEVEILLRASADQTVDLTYSRLKERIDRLGVVQPNVSLDKSRDLIMVEMPGIDNPERARQFLSTSAELQFWETYRVTDAGIFAGLQEADRRLKGDTSALNVPLDSASLAANRGPLLAALTLNNAANPSNGITVVGTADRNKKEAISAMLAKPEIASLFPQTLKFLWSYKPIEDATGLTTNQYSLHAIKTVAGSDKAPLGGEVITDASPTQDQVSGQPQVNILMNGEGAKEWARLTGKAYEGNAEGKQREIAIVLDEGVVTAPSVNNGPITGGSSVITGSFSTQEANDLASILEVGKLPAKTTIIQESNVGPSLGKDNINKSLIALSLGFLLVMAFMIFYYSGAGVIAVLALFANLLFIMICLSSFGTVLTLPGIAGIVLTIGMAVDANVIIYERVREVLREGKSLTSAISEGFQLSLPAILDANITTLIVGLVLAYFGLGPIKGFAVTLILGIITSLFTAILLSKMMAEGWIKEGTRNLSFWTPMTKDTFKDINVDWVGKRKIAYAVSSVLVLAGLVSIFTKGFDLGVDFKGGHSYNIQFAPDAKVDVEDLRNKLTAAFGTAPIVKVMDTDNTFNVISTYKIEETGASIQEEVTQKLYDGIKSFAGNTSIEAFKRGDNNGAKILSYNKTGPTVADDITKSAYLAGIISLLLIFIYILFRFSKWQYSVGAIVALIHDALATIGVFSLLKGLVPWSLEIDQAFVAAILTIIGFSINDTVIVFDRIKEFLNSNIKGSREQLINMAINTTFSRTIFTSLTVLFVVLVLFLFGGSSLKNFSFAMVIGVIFGVYSSVYIATPLMIDLSKDDLSMGGSTSTKKTVEEKKS